MKLSIIIPCYNVDAYIDECLGSILPQLTDECELIVCDDFSTDNTVEKVERWQKKHKFELIKQIENYGVSHSRNECIKKSKGKYLTFIDGDDIVESDYIANILSAIETNLDIYKTGWTMFGKDTMIIYGDKQPNWNWSVWCVVWKKESITTLFDETMAKHEDGAFRKANITDNTTIGYIEKPIYRYRSGRAGSLMNSDIRVYLKNAPLDIVFYFEELYKIGGVETWGYYLIKDLAKHGRKVRVVYENGANSKQVARLKKICLTEPFDIADKTCDVVVHRNYASKVPLNAQKNIQVIHANFSEVNGIKFHKISDKYVAVSDTTKECASHLGIDIDVIENYIPDFISKEYKKRKKERDYIKIISATRLSWEKGYSKMVEFAQLLKKEGINYKWYVYTVDSAKIDNNLFIHMSPELNIVDEIADSDYLAQFSDTEAYCYSAHEALAVGTPILITEWTGNPLTKDNGYSYNQIMENPHIIENIPKKFKFVQTSGIQQWLDYFDKLEKELKEEMNNTVRVKALYNFHATQENKHFKANGIYRVTPERAEEMASKNNEAHKPVVIKLNN